METKHFDWISYSLNYWCRLHLKLTLYNFLHLHHHHQNTLYSLTNIQSCHSLPWILSFLSQVFKKEFFYAFHHLPSIIMYLYKLYIAISLILYSTCVYIRKWLYIIMNIVLISVIIYQEYSSYISYTSILKCYKFKRW